MNILLKQFLESRGGSGSTCDVPVPGPLMNRYVAANGISPMVEECVRCKLHKKPEHLVRQNQSWTWIYGIYKMF